MGDLDIANLQLFGTTAQSRPIGNRRAHMHVHLEDRAELLRHRICSRAG